MIDNEIRHEDFQTIINEEKNIENWKEALEWWIVIKVMLKKLVSLKMVKNYEVIKRNEIINNSIINNEIINNSIINTCKYKKWNHIFQSVEKY